MKKLGSFKHILNKLQEFTKKYYTKTFLKGLFLFMVFGIIFLLTILGVEYFLWLNSTGRFILLLIFIVVEALLLYTYIVIPLFYLFRLKNGISNKDASLMIGKHFPEIGDKLYNLLDLAEDTNQSELLLASIEQRSQNLDPIPFVKAVNFTDSFKYAKYLLIPFVLIALIWFSGNFNSFFGSYSRVIHYDMAYVPPAPFSFLLQTNNLDVLENEPFTVQVTTVGKVKPEDVFVVVDGTDYLLQNDNGRYIYTFSPPLKRTDFFFEANGIKSKPYTLHVLKVPSIQNFNMVLHYPKYIQRAAETIRGTGNATFPEGTRVQWQIQGENTDGISLITKDSSRAFHKDNGWLFSAVKRVYGNLDYEISTSNSNVEHYENLAYRFKVIKDAYPTIKVTEVRDSLNPNRAYYAGEVADDYKLRSIELVCYPVTQEENKEVIELMKPNTNFDQFYYTFPSGLHLTEGQQYNFYFVARDNDAIHHGKTTRSRVFNLTVLDSNQLRNKELDYQNVILNNFDRSLDNYKDQKEALKEINNEQKEKNRLNFTDQNKVKEFLRKQEHQESLMQQFSKQLKESLDKENKDDKGNRLLKERLERQELAAKRNQKLLEELNKVADKIDKEELAKRLEELGKQQQNGQRNLEQLLELTKRYYVTEKASQLAKDLKNLGIKQENLANQQAKKITSESNQEQLNKEFKGIGKELDTLKRDNQDLKKPLELTIDPKKKKGIEREQQEALDEIKEQQTDKEAPSGSEKAKKAGQQISRKQQSAAQKMRKMADEIEQSSTASAGGGASITEDAEMLRQILDNLVTFSFKQEALFDDLAKSGGDMNHYTNDIRKQQELKMLFEHVDDSLFALSLRRAEIAELVNEQITEVYYNIDKSLDRIADNQIYQGVSYQQRVITASNVLSDFLANLLDNMQQSMKPGKGGGSGSDGGFQLPDIIKGQGKVGEQMGRMGSSEKGKEGQKRTRQGKQGEEGSQSGNEENGKRHGKETTKSKEGRQGIGSQSETELQEIYEIYKEQQRLRQKLNDQLEDMLNAGDRELAKKVIKQMEDFENDLLENGITKRTVDKAGVIQYQLLKLKNAALRQGKKSTRESITNKSKFSNPILTKPAALDNYHNEIEILNRQALPLQQNFKSKVKDYFNGEH